MNGKRKRYKRSYKRVIILAIILVAMTVTAFAYHFLKQREVAPLPSAPEEGKLAIMLMGVDTRKDDVGRSDTLMVLTVDKKTGAVSIYSIPRDTRVQIPGYGYNKINAAYAFGGEPLTQKTVEKLLGIHMKYYIVVNMQAFENIINDIGGVDIDVQKRMYYNDPYDDDGGLHIDFYPGMQHMDGKKAIEYVRFRDAEGDIGRIRRQQYFINAVLKKVLTPEILPKLPKLVEEASKTVKTDIPFQTMMELAKLLPDMRNKTISSEMFPGTPAYISDISYWLPNILKARQEIYAKLGIEMTPAMTASTNDLMAEYKASLPKELKIVDGTYDYSSANNKQTGSTAEKNNNDSNSKQNDAQKTNSSDQGKEQKQVQTAESVQEKLRAPDVTVMVINCSGIDGAGARVADILRKRGFKISTVETGNTSDKKHTDIITNQGATDLFYGLPFPCTIMTGPNLNKGQAIVRIGLDYKK